MTSTLKFKSQLYLFASLLVASHAKSAFLPNGNIAHTRTGTTSISTKNNLKSISEASCKSSIVDLRGGGEGDRGYGEGNGNGRDRYDYDYEKDDYAKGQGGYGSQGDGRHDYEDDRNEGGIHRRDDYEDDYHGGDRDRDYSVSLVNL